MQLYEQIENVPKYKNGSNAIPKDEIVIQYSALKQSFIRFLESECERLEKGKYQQPLLGTPLHTEELMIAVNKTLQDIISHYQNMIKELQA